MPADNRVVARYRYWYRKLLRFYARPFRERFAEGMEQTFADLCRDRVDAGKSLLAFVIWVFFETSVAIVRQNLAGSHMQMRMQNISKKMKVWAVVVAILLIVPVLGNMFIEGWNWGPLDFVFAGGLLFGSALTYELVARMKDTTVYRAAVGIAVATALFLVWVNAAVGIIGDGPVNLMYLGVVAVGIVGALFARFEPRGMSVTLLAMAVAQMSVPVIALVVWNPPFDPGVVPVFALNAVFAALWISSAWLFRRASSIARTPHGAPDC